MKEVKNKHKHNETELSFNEDQKSGQSARNLPDLQTIT